MDDKLTAVIADDEPLLSKALAAELAKLWPTLSIVAIASNGSVAIEAIMEHQPDIVFLDIQMPGATGIEVAETIADDWPEGSSVHPLPLIVFVTAFDDYAVEAFKSAAVDYLLKPVNSNRLASTIDRLKQRLQSSIGQDMTELGTQLRLLLATEHAHQQTNVQTEAPLRIIRASVGDAVKMIPTEEIILFESADKYVSVFTQTQEALIRESLRSLLPQLDNNQFAQIHRGAIVNLNHVEAAVKEDTGKVTLRLKGHDKTPVVSRIYRHLFQAM